MIEFKLQQHPYEPYGTNQDWYMILEWHDRYEGYLDEDYSDDEFLLTLSHFL